MSTHSPLPSAERSRSTAESRRQQLEHLRSVCERGVESCRRGQWKEGLSDLAWLTHGKVIRGIPSVCYAYLGFGMAKYKKNVPAGVRLCRLALRMEFYQTENYVLLARVCMLSARYRRQAYEAVRTGLEMDPGSLELLALQSELGVRRPPVLGFLDRGNPLNRLLGGLRHLFLPNRIDVSESRHDTGKMIASIAR